MDEKFSVHLPEVTSPASALETLETSFPGAVVRADTPADVASLELKPDTQYLIIVSLSPITGQNEYSEFQANGE